MQQFPALVLVLYICLLAACTDQEPARPGVLRIGVLPDSAPDILKAKYKPLVDYLQGETGIPSKLIIPADYEELLTMFHNQAIDLAFFGGYTYVIAHERDHAVPLAMRDVDLQLTSQFLVRADNPATSLEDLKGKRFAFGSDLSTSGHLMPRYFLRERGIVPEKFFSETLYSGAHDRTAYWVRDGKIDAGVANSKIIRNMFADGKLDEHDIRILWETPPYSDYVWAIQINIDPVLRQQILDSLLSLSIDNPKQRLMLEAMNVQRKFLPALDKDFTVTREAIKLVNNIQ
jgi:phosphonate transport system substrate-binding protein